MKVYERVGENDNKDRQSTTMISITERKTGFQMVSMSILVPRGRAPFGKH